MPCWLGGEGYKWNYCQSAGPVRIDFLLPVCGDSWPSIKHVRLEIRRYFPKPNSRARCQKNLSRKFRARRFGATGLEPACAPKRGS